MDAIIRVVGALSLWGVEIVMQMRIYALYRLSRRVCSDCIRHIGPTGHSAFTGCYSQRNPLHWFCRRLPMDSHPQWDGPRISHRRSQVTPYSRLSSRSHRYRVGAMGPRYASWSRCMVYSRYLTIVQPLSTRAFCSAMPYGKPERTLSQECERMAHRW